jgi:hypothetical protein
MTSNTTQTPGRPSTWSWKPLASVLALSVVCLAVSAMGTDPTAPAPTPALPASPHVALQLSPGSVVVSGQVPDAVEHAAMLWRVRSLYRDMAVHDQLSVGGVTNPNWLSAAFLPDLRGATQASVRLSNGSLVLEGEVPTEQLKTRLDSAVGTARAAGLEVVVRLSVQPA